MVQAAQHRHVGSTQSRLQGEAQANVSRLSPRRPSGAALPALPVTQGRVSLRPRAPKRWKTHKSSAAAAPLPAWSSSTRMSAVYLLKHQLYIHIHLKKKKYRIIQASRAAYAYTNRSAQERNKRRINTSNTLQRALVKQPVGSPPSKLQLSNSR